MLAPKRTGPDIEQILRSQRMLGSGRLNKKQGDKIRNRSEANSGPCQVTLVSFLTLVQVTLKNVGVRVRGERLLQGCQNDPKSRGSKVPTKLTIMAAHFSAAFTVASAASPSSKKFEAGSWSNPCPSKVRFSRNHGERIGGGSWGGSWRGSCAGSWSSEIGGGWGELARERRMARYRNISRTKYEK